MSRRAIVVFVGKELVDGPAWYARWLKAGFIHCCVILEIGGRTVLLDGQRGKVEIHLFGDIEKVVSWYRDQGATLVETTVGDEKLYVPFVARTCVGLIKTVLGIRSWCVTPFGLYKHLTKG